MVKLYSREWMMIHNNELLEKRESLFNANYLYGSINIELIDEHSMFEPLENKKEFVKNLKKNKDYLIAEIPNMIALFAKNKVGEPLTIDHLKDTDYVVLMNDSSMAKEMVKAIKESKYDKVFTYFI